MTAARKPPVDIVNLMRLQNMRDRAEELRNRSLERATDYQDQLDAFDAIIAFITPPAPPARTANR